MKLKIAIPIAISVILLILVFEIVANRNSGTELADVSTTRHFFSPNDKVSIERFDDPDIPGVACWLSRARTGGYNGAAGLAEDPSRMAISCAKTGPIRPSTDLAKLSGEVVFSERASVLFKTISVHRFYDVEAKAICYLVTSSKVIEGSPANALSCIGLN